MLSWLWFLDTWVLQRSSLVRSDWAEQATRCPRVRFNHSSGSSVVAKGFSAIQRRLGRLRRPSACHHQTLRNDITSSSSTSNGSWVDHIRVCAASLEGFLARHHVVRSASRSNFQRTCVLIAFPVLVLFFKHRHLCSVSDELALLTCSTCLPLESTEGKTLMLRDPSAHKVDDLQAVSFKEFIFLTLVPDHVSFDF
jgi:hypothetical protein